MAAGDLTTLANVEGWLGLTVGVNPAVDTLLTRLITACSTFIAQFTSRTFALASYNETRNGMGGHRMVLLNTPIVSVSSVTINGTVVPPRAPLTQLQTTNPDGYVNDDSSVMVTGWWKFWPGFQNVVIAYSAGFAAVPFDLEQACVDTVGDWFKYRDRVGKLDEAIEQQTIRFTNTDFPERAMGVILTYKRVSPIY